MQRVLICNWGRRGAFPRFALKLFEALRSRTDVSVAACISSHAETAADFPRHNPNVHALPMFRTGRGALLSLWRAPGLISRFRTILTEFRPDTVIEVAAHVWSPLFEAAIRGSGARRIVLVHDATAHPGDLSGVTVDWLLRSSLRADCIVTLSSFVANELARLKNTPPHDTVKTLFHPVFVEPAQSAPPSWTGGPLRIAFLGRLLAYKGLDTLLAAIETLKANGANVHLGVFGEGQLQQWLPKLQALNAEIVNRWLSDAEIAQILARHHVLAAPYKEASQSGVVAAAFAAGRPVIATPVGALPEQVQHELNGLIADDASHMTFAAALRRLHDDRVLLERLAHNAVGYAKSHSADVFVDRLLQL